MGLQGLDNINNICVAGGKKGNGKFTDWICRAGEEGNVEWLSKQKKESQKEELVMGSLGDPASRMRASAPHSVSAFLSLLCPHNCARVEPPPPPLGIKGSLQMNLELRWWVLCP